MVAVIQKPTLGQRVSGLVEGFDGPLAFAVFVLACVGLMIMYSSGYDHGSRFIDHTRNMVLAGFIMLVVAQVPPQKLMAWAVPLYAVGVFLSFSLSQAGMVRHWWRQQGPGWRGKALVNGFGAVATWLGGLPGLRRRQP